MPRRCRRRPRPDVPPPPARPRMNVWEDMLWETHAKVPESWKMRSLDGVMSLCERFNIVCKNSWACSRPEGLPKSPCLPRKWSKKKLSPVQENRGTRRQNSRETSCLVTRPGFEIVNSRSVTVEAEQDHGPVRQQVRREGRQAVTHRQGSVSGSGLIWVAGSESRRAKMAHKNRKKYIIFMFWSAGWSLLRADGFFCNLDVLYGGLGISKLQFLIKKIKKLNFQL